MKNSGEAKLLLVMGLFVLLGGGALVWMNRSPGATPLPSPPTAAATPAPVVWDAAKFDEAIKDARYALGPENAPFTLVEFADFECPSCRRAYNATLKPLEKSGRIRFHFRHYPWPYHTHAMPAALAAEAAGEQGKFWEMYDALFEGEETQLSDEYITEKAKALGLDMAKFDKARGEGSPLAANIEADKALADKLGIASTPTVVIRDNASGKFYQALGAGELSTYAPLLNGKGPAPTPSAGPDPAAHPDHPGHEQHAGPAAAPAPPAGN